MPVIGSGGNTVNVAASASKRVTAPVARVVTAGDADGPGGSFDGEHNDLDGREEPDAHPISAITGLQGALDNASGGTAFIYDSSGAQNGNRYNDWEELIVALAAAPEGPKIVQFRQDETIPAGEWDLSGATLSGYRPATTFGALTVVTFADGCSLVNVSGDIAQDGLILHSASTAPVIELEGPGTWFLNRDAICTSTAAPVISVNTPTGALSFLVLNRGWGFTAPSGLGVTGDDEPSLLVEGDGMLALVGPAGVAFLADDQITGTTGAVVVVPQSASAFIDPASGGRSWTSQVHPTVFTNLQNRAINIAVESSGFDGVLSSSDVDVQAALETIDALGAADVGAAADDDARLTDARTPLAHTHGAADVTSGTFDAARIPNLDASKITTGTVAPERLGSGTPSSSNFLRGDGSWQAPPDPGNPDDVKARLLAGRSAPATPVTGFDFTTEDFGGGPVGPDLTYPGYAIETSALPWDPIFSIAAAALVPSPPVAGARLLGARARARVELVDAAYTDVVAQVVLVDGTFNAVAGYAVGTADPDYAPGISIATVPVSDEFVDLLVVLDEPISAPSGEILSVGWAAVGADPDIGDGATLHVESLDWLWSEVGVRSDDERLLPDPAELDDGWVATIASGAWVALPASGGGGLRAVRVATTAAITLSGAQTIDGVAVIADDLVLVKDNAGTANGVYAVKAGSWVEESWSTGDQTITVIVEAGAVNGGRIFTNASNISPLTTSVPASSVTGVLDPTNIPGIPASKIVSGLLESDVLTYPGLPGWNYVGPTTTFPAGGGVQPLAETLPPWIVTGNAAALVSGRMSIVGIVLTKGQSLTSVGFYSATTALSAGTNQWFCILNSAMQIVAVTVNDTSTAWTANTLKVLALTGTYVVPSTGQYHLGIVVTASTVPTLSAVITLPTARRPRSFIADTGLTTPQSVGWTATPTANVTNTPWGFVA
jgi:hypothetical protein